MTIKQTFRSNKKPKYHRTTNILKA